MLKFSGQKVRDRRKSLGMRREVLAVHIDKSFTMLARYEKELSMPRADVLVLMAAALQCDVGDLFDSVA